MNRKKIMKAVEKVLTERNLSQYVINSIYSAMECMEDASLLWYANDIGINTDEILKVEISA